MGHSHDLFAQAKRYIPGGVNSPVRSFQSVGGEPLFFKSGQGAYLVDEQDKRYIDYVGSWGPMIAGHAHPHIIEAVTHRIKHGLSFGAPTRLETQLAEKICQLMPAIEQIRMVNSGTEASMSAIRLARGFTKRNKILKFAGCYHGHADSLLVQAGSGALTLGIPSSAGVPARIAEDTLVAEFNQLATVKALFALHGEDIAAVIVEPIAGNMNCILPQPRFLAGLRELCNHYQSVLIFDEVMTGFRVALGGAQGYFDIKPDLTILGKIIGGGMPVGALGGRSDIMQCLAPEGPVYQAGTLSGNPIAMTAGLATLDLVTAPGFYKTLTHLTEQLMSGLKQLAKQAGIACHTVSIGGMFGLFFTEASTVATFEQVKQCNIPLFKQFFHGMLQEGVYFAPSAFEAGFVSAAHSEKEVAYTLQAASKVFSTISASITCSSQEIHCN